MTQHLVVIQGKKAYRYAGPKRIETAEICFEDVTVEEAKAAIEDFRQNGAAPPILQAADIVFDRASRDLTSKPPLEGMTAEELQALWSKARNGEGVIAGTHYHIDAVRAELASRGLPFELEG